MGKYIDNYKNFNDISSKVLEANFSNIFEINDYFNSINESLRDFGENLILGARIRKMQEQSNEFKIEAVRQEAIQKLKIEDALAAGHTVDYDAIRDILKRKTLALERQSISLEDEAARLAGRSMYLIKVLREKRLEGELAVSDARIKLANYEEAKALKVASGFLKTNIKDEIDDIKKETKDINDNKNKEKDKEVVLSFDDINKMDLSDDMKIDLLKARWKIHDSDIEEVRRMKRAELRKEANIIKGIKSKSKYDKKIEAGEKENDEPSTSFNYDYKFTYPGYQTSTSNSIKLTDLENEDEPK